MLHEGNVSRLLPTRSHLSRFVSIVSMYIYVSRICEIKLVNNYLKLIFRIELERTFNSLSLWLNCIIAISFVSTQFIILNIWGLSINRHNFSNKENWSGIIYKEKRKLDNKWNAFRISFLNSNYFIYFYLWTNWNKKELPSAVCTMKFPFYNVIIISLSD